MLSGQRMVSELLDRKAEPTEPATISRPFYEERLRSLSAGGEIVVLQGVRRGGKSTLLRNAVRAS